MKKRCENAQYFSDLGITVFAYTPAVLPDNDRENYKHRFDYLTSELADIKLKSYLLHGYSKAIQIIT